MRTQMEISLQRMDACLSGLRQFFMGWVGVTLCAQFKLLSDQSMKLLKFRPESEKVNGD